MIGARDSGGARRQPEGNAGVVTTAAERLRASSTTIRLCKDENRVDCRQRTNNRYARSDAGRHLWVPWF